MVKYNPKLKEKARRRRVWMTAGERALGHGYEIEGVMEVIPWAISESLEAKSPLTPLSTKGGITGCRSAS